MVVLTNFYVASITIHSEKLLYKISFQNTIILIISNWFIQRVIK